MSLTGNRTVKLTSSKLEVGGVAHQDTIRPMTNEQMIEFAIVGRATSEQYGTQGTVVLLRVLLPSDENADGTDCHTADP